MNTLYKDDTLQNHTPETYIIFLLSNVTPINSIRNKNVKTTERTLSLEYGPYSALEFHIQYSFLKAPIRGSFHIVPTL